MCPAVPRRVVRLVDQGNDARLPAAAAQRMERLDPARTVSGDGPYSGPGVTREDLDGCGEVEIG